MATPHDFTRDLTGMSPLDHVLGGGLAAGGRAARSPGEGSASAVSSSAVRPLSAKDLDRLCRLAAVGDVGLAVPHARRGRWLFALKRGLARWGPTPPRNMGGQLLYPGRIYITDVGRTLAKMCP